MPRLTEEEARDIIAKIQAARLEEHYTNEEACKKFGMTLSQYGYWVAKFKTGKVPYSRKRAQEMEDKQAKKQPVLAHITLPNEEEDVSVVILKGSSSSVERITQNLAAILGNI